MNAQEASVISLRMKPRTEYEFDDIQKRYDDPDKFEKHVRDMIARAAWAGEFSTRIPKMRPAPSLPEVARRLDKDGFKTRVDKEHYGDADVLFVWWNN